MLPEWETNHPRQRGPNKAHLNQDSSDRTPRGEHLSKDMSFNDINETYADDRSFLPGIGNSRQADSFRTIGQNNNEKRHYHNHNRSVFDRQTISDEKKIPPLNARSHNNSIEKSSNKKNFDDSASYEFENPQEPSIVEQNDIAHTPSKADPQQIFKQNHLPNTKFTEDQIDKVISDVSPKDRKENKKAYGQYLLDQMKANESRKNIEKQQRREEDRQLLNQNGFFDRFGKSRDRFLNKYRSKLYQSPVIGRENNKHVSLAGFDKINNHERNYNLYYPTSHGGLDLSFNRHNTPQLRKIKNRTEEKENHQAVNRTIQPHYQNDLLDSPEQNETDKGEEIAEKNVFDYPKNKSPGFHENERKPANGLLKPSEYPRANIHYKNDLDAPVNGGLNWKPSTNKITSDTENLKNYISKLEYQKVLDQQILEKQFQKAHEQKVREMEDIIEELRLSRERLMKELESNSITPKTKMARKYYKQSDSQPPTHRLNQNNENNNFQKNFHHHNVQNPHGIGGGASNPIVLQPGDFNPKPNKSLLYNNSSRRTLNDNKLSSRRELHDRIETENAIFQNHPNDQANSELRNLREELRENSKRYHGQLADVKNYLQKPTQVSKGSHKDPPNIKESDSKTSLVNETKFVPINSNNIKLEKEPSENHRNKVQRLDSPNSHDEKHFTHPKVIQKNLANKHSDIQNHTEGIGSTIDKEAIDKLMNFALGIENSVKNQNLELKREINDLKLQLAKILEGNGDRIEYDSINMRLNQIKDDRKDTHTIHSVQSKNSEHKHSNDSIKASPIMQNSQSQTKPMNNSPIRSSPIEQKNEPQNIKEIKAFIPSKIEQKTQSHSPNITDKKNLETWNVDQKSNNPKASGEKTPQSSKSSEVKNEGSKSPVVNKSETQTKAKAEDHNQIEKTKQSQTRNLKDFKLRKLTRGTKRSIRTGEEELFKKI